VATDLVDPAVADPRFRTRWRLRVADQLSDRPLILVVDDFESVRTLITLALLRAGYHVLSASSHAEAIALLDRLRLQVSGAVLDLHFPITSEDQVTTEMRRRSRTFPCFFSRPEDTTPTRSSRACCWRSLSVSGRSAESSRTCSR